MTRYVWLTCCSYVFYGYWNFKFCFWMALSTLISYCAGLGLRRWDVGWQRKACVVLPISIDLAILGVFKYTNFILNTFQILFREIGSQAHVPIFQIILQVGISFYTFHTISYIVDSYRRTIHPTSNFWEFACYVCLFSQLVAGPIVRFRQVEGDLDHIDSANRREVLDRAWSFFTIGLIKKVLIADSLAVLINPGLRDYSLLSGLGVWMCMLGYAYQLYFDFSGYSDMAVGLGQLFGIRLPQNFNSPYKSTSIADFWHRWHISLSTCLRDYVYIPLGGNRGSAWHVSQTIMVTMLLGGLWHGASWTFVAWGAYHGLLLLFYRWSQYLWEQWPLVIRRSGTFLLVLLGWVLFRSNDWGMAASLLRAMSVGRKGQLPSGALALAGLLVLCAGLAHLGPNTFEMSHKWRPAQVSAFAALFFLCLLVLYGNPASPFLYFQF